MALPIPRSRARSDRPLTNDRAVRTASSEQVRRPIFTDAVDHWRHYETMLAPLFAVLGPIADCYPDVPAAIAAGPAITCAATPDS